LRIFALRKRISAKHRTSIKRKKRKEEKVEEIH
jgi:hypothetical protein